MFLLCFLLLHLCRLFLYYNTVCLYTDLETYVNWRKVKVLCGWVSESTLLSSLSTNCVCIMLVRLCASKVKCKFDPYSPAILSTDVCGLLYQQHGKEKMNRKTTSNKSSRHYTIITIARIVKSSYNWTDNVGFTFSYNTSTFSQGSVSVGKRDLDFGYK